MSTVITQPTPPTKYTQAQIDDIKKEIALCTKEYKEETEPVMKRRKLVRLRNMKSVLRQMTKGKGTWAIVF